MSAAVIGRRVCIMVTKQSKRYALSCGPGDASGWYCTLKIGLAVWRKPASVASFRCMCVGSPPTARSDSSSTQKPWFWLVISTRPVSRLRTGWFAPRWPNLSFHVFAPSASASSWWPRQMPKVGTSPAISRSVAMVRSTAAGSPGPLEMKSPSGLRARISAALRSCGTTSMSQPRSARLR